MVGSPSEPHDPVNLLVFLAQKFNHEDFTFALDFSSNGAFSWFRHEFNEVKSCRDMDIDPIRVITDEQTASVKFVVGCVPNQIQKVNNTLCDVARS
jgi:hypothetical protein